MGVTLALEEEKANGTEIEDAAIQGVKIGMMGPLAGIGDQMCIRDNLQWHQYLYRQGQSKVDDQELLIR